MASPEIIWKARQNGQNKLVFGKRVNVKEIVDLLVESSEHSRHAAVRQNANRLLEEMAERPWRATAGIHKGGFGGGGRRVDMNRHMTIQTGRGGYHLRVDARGHLFEVTGPRMEEGIYPWTAPGTRPSAGRRGQRGFIEVGLLMAVGQTIALVAFAALIGYLRGLVDQWLFEEQMKDLEPAIRRRVREKSEQILEIQASGRQAWANVTIIAKVTITENIQGLRGSMSVTSKTPPFLTLGGVDISDQNVVSEGPVTVEKLWWSQTRQESHSFTFSFEVEVPEEAVDAYLDYQMELQLQEDAWRGPPLTFRYYLRLMRKKYYLDNVLRILRNGPDKEYTPPAKPPAQGMAPPPQARPAAPKPAVPKPPPPKPPPAKAPTMSPDEPVA